MRKRLTPDQEKWVEGGLSAVANGRSTMSQRSAASINKHAGSLKALAAAARKRGVHLLLFEDETGKPLVAASLKPFKVLT